MIILTLPELTEDETLAHRRFLLALLTSSSMERESRQDPKKGVAKVSASTPLLVNSAGDNEVLHCKATLYDMKTRFDFVLVLL